MSVFLVKIEPALSDWIQTLMNLATKKSDLGLGFHWDIIAHSDSWF